MLASLVLIAMGLWSLGAAAAEPGEGAPKGSASKAGSRRCGYCHSLQYAEWSAHAHSRFLADPRRDLRAVAAQWGDGVPGWRELLGGRFRQAEASLCFGALQVQVFFREDPDGHRLLPAQWNLRERRWEPLPPDLEAIRRERRTWEEECAGCHVTAFEPPTGAYAERGASCPSCHGDGAAHAATEGAAPIVAFAKLSPPRRTDVCGRCHSRGRERGGRRPFPTSFSPGQALDQSFDLAAPAAGRASSLFWPDGTERANFMQYQGFLQSRHHRVGLACSTCHLAHGSDHPHHLREKTSELCRGCHRVAGAASPVHRGHPDGQADCVDCHMAVVNPSPNEAHAHTHTFRFLEPAGSLAAGMPNGCTAACHPGKGAAWADAAVREWRGQ